MFLRKIMKIICDHQDVGLSATQSDRMSDWCDFLGTKSDISLQTCMRRSQLSCAIRSQKWPCM